MKKYILQDFMDDFSDDEACLEWLKNHLYPDGIYCKICEQTRPHHLVKSRKSYVCQNCGHHVHPTADTIFHKSSTSLSTWFYTIHQIVQTQGKISAKQIQSDTGVTYKTAWRMKKLICSRLDDGLDVFGKIDDD